MNPHNAHLNRLVNRWMFIAFAAMCGVSLLVFLVNSPLLAWVNSNCRGDASLACRGALFLVAHVDVLMFPVLAAFVFLLHRIVPMAQATPRTADTPRE